MRPATIAGPDGIVTWPRAVSSCGRCGTAVGDHEAACPGCGQTAGPFERVTARACVRRDDTGTLWLQPAADAGGVAPRRLSVEQARWLTRRDGRP
jgi:hypothetical protein